ncbi:MAG: aldo/keto reductase [Veillonella parvula]|uniref:aldo/keto reductase n=1 Tax=Veillonella parvula TaxID=29466 RepID=UPI0039A21E9D
MRYYDLNDGNKIPILGFGVWQIEDKDLCEEIVDFVLKQGCRLLDTATVYQNEQAVGAGIKKSGIPREEIFVTSKLWVQDMGYEKTKSAIDRLLNRMGLEYLDMYLIHHSFGDYIGSWKAMEEAVAMGKIKTIGVANFSIKQLKDLMNHATIRPAVNQIEFHPFCQQKELRAYMEEQHIQLEAWSPLGSGNKELLNDTDLTQIAEKYKKNVGQIILRWHIQEKSVAIPKSVHKERIIGNFSIWDFELTDEEMRVIRSKDTGSNILGYNPDNPSEWKDFITNLIVES